MCKIDEKRWFTFLYDLHGALVFINVTPGRLRAGDGGSDFREVMCHEKTRVLSCWGHSDRPGHEIPSMGGSSLRLRGFADLMSQVIEKSLEGT